jgi:hypothetical protein
VPPPPPGVYHYLRQDEHSKTRLHLRVEPDQSCHLDRECQPHVSSQSHRSIYGLSAPGGGSPFEQARICLYHSYFNVPARQARQDLRRFHSAVSRFDRSRWRLPGLRSRLEVTAPFSDRPSAPYRMDLALTYRCQNDCAHCYNVRGRRPGELSTDEMAYRCWTGCGSSVSRISFLPGANQPCALTCPT